MCSHAYFDFTTNTKVSIQGHFPITGGAKSLDLSAPASGATSSQPLGTQSISHPSYLFSGESQRTTFTTVTQPQVPPGFTQPPMYHHWVFNPTLYGLPVEAGNTAAPPTDGSGTHSQGPERSVPTSASQVEATTEKRCIVIKGNGLFFRSTKCT